MIVSTKLPIDFIMNESQPSFDAPPVESEAQNVKELLSTRLESFVHELTVEQGALDGEEWLVDTSLRQRVLEVALKEARDAGLLDQSLAVDASSPEKLLESAQTILSALNEPSNTSGSELAA